MATDALTFVRWLDVILLIVSLPVVLLSGLPRAGYLVAVVVWILQRAIGHAVEQRTRRARSPREFLGLTLGSTLARGWVVALAILAVGLGVGRAHGLMAAVTIFAAFTVYFALAVVTRPTRSANTGGLR